MKFFRTFFSRSENKLYKEPVFSFEEIMKDFEPFRSEQISLVKRRDKQQYSEWNKIITRIDGLPQDGRVGQATDLVQRVSGKVAEQCWEDLYAHFFALNASKRFFMRRVTQQLESLSAQQGKRQKEVAAKESIGEASGTTIALLSELNAIPGITLFCHNFRHVQRMFYAYTKEIQNAVNAEDADLRYVVKCINAMERASEEQLRQNLRGKKFADDRRLGEQDARKLARKASLFIGNCETLDMLLRFTDSEVNVRECIKQCEQLNESVLCNYQKIKDMHLEYSSFSLEDFQAAVEYHLKKYEHKLQELGRNDR